MPLAVPSSAACRHSLSISIFFFFNDTATPEIYTLSLHDALPISYSIALRAATSAAVCAAKGVLLREPRKSTDRKSTRLNSSHANISYAVFCLKKKTTLQRRPNNYPRHEKLRESMRR